MISREEANRIVQALEIKCMDRLNGTDISHINNLYEYLHAQPIKSDKDIEEVIIWFENNIKLVQEDEHMMTHIFEIEQSDKWQILKNAYLPKLSDNVEEDLEVVSSIVESWLVIINEDLGYESAFVNVKINMGTFQKIKSHILAQASEIENYKRTLHDINYIDNLVVKERDILQSKLNAIEEVVKRCYPTDQIEGFKQIQQILKGDGNNEK